MAKTGPLSLKFTKPIEALPFVYSVQKLTVKLTDEHNNIYKKTKLALKLKMHCPGNPVSDEFDDGFKVLNEENLYICNMTGTSPVIEVQLLKCTERKEVVLSVIPDLKNTKKPVSKAVSAVSSDPIQVVRHRLELSNESQIPKEWFKNECGKDNFKAIVLKLQLVESYIDRKGESKKRRVVMDDDIPLHSELFYEDGQGAPETLLQVVNKPFISGSSGTGELICKIPAPLKGKRKSRKRYYVKISPDLKQNAAHAHINFSRSPVIEIKSKISNANREKRLQRKLDESRKAAKMSVNSGLSCNCHYRAFSIKANRVINRSLSSSSDEGADTDEAVVIPRTDLLELVRQFEAIDHEWHAETTLPPSKTKKTADSARKRSRPPGPDNKPPVLLAAAPVAVSSGTISTAASDRSFPLPSSSAEGATGPTRPSNSEPSRTAGNHSAFLPSCTSAMPVFSSSSIELSSKRKFKECASSSSTNNFLDVSSSSLGFFSNSATSYPPGRPSFHEHPSSSSSSSSSVYEFQQALSGNASASIMNFVNSLASSASSEGRAASTRGTTTSSCENNPPGCENNSPWWEDFDVSELPFDMDHAVGQEIANATATACHQ